MGPGRTIFSSFDSSHSRSLHLPDTQAPRHRHTDTDTYDLYYPSTTNVAQSLPTSEHQARQHGYQHGRQSQIDQTMCACARVHRHTHTHIQTHTHTRTHTHTHVHKQTDTHRHVCVCVCVCVCSRDAACARPGRSTGPGHAQLLLQLGRTEDAEHFPRQHPVNAIPQRRDLSPC